MIPVRRQFLDTGLKFKKSFFSRFNLTTTVNRPRFLSSVNTYPIKSISNMNILLYSGEGTSPSSLQQTEFCLRKLLGDHYAVTKVDKKVLRDEPWEDKTSLLVIPGGRDLPYCRDLDGLANDRIKKYVNEGGNYLGFCAGGYYGSGEVDFEKGTSLEVLGERELKFFPGCCKGCVYPGFVYDSEAGATAASIELDSVFAFSNKELPKKLKVYYNGGGYFAKPYQYQNTKVLAWYEKVGNSEPKPAIVRCQVGKGIAVLTGVHPEYSAERFNIQQYEKPQLVKDLVEHETGREALMRTLLSHMGLVLNDDGFILPDPTPIYFCSTPSNTLISLRNRFKDITDQNDKLEDILDTFQFIFKDDIGSELAGMKVGKEENEKTIIICQSPPKSSYTPEFNINTYFENLRKERMRLKANPISSQFGSHLMYSEVITSTQTMITKNPTFAANLPNGLVCIGTKQLAGKGRGQNSWVSPPGCLQFSMLLRHPLKSSGSAIFVQYLLSLAIVEGVRGKPGYEEIPVRIKWPNDVYAATPETMYLSEPKYVKIGGILVNSSFSNNEFELVAGAGVNADNSYPTTSINRLIESYNEHNLKKLPLLSQEELAASIFATFNRFYNEFCENGNGFVPFLELYYKRWLHSHKIITLQEHDSARVRIVGITHDYGFLETVAIDDNNMDLKQKYTLQPDGNSFDMMKGLISRKAV
ncbi:biotin holocarboxylase synthetase [Basidiobolus ranarum]|uniref:Biotin holocarboxylase synthetase n=1 Tax=Basidiobolus ranarum TaxID=34480 RepID=A0ABR2VVE5_9FUNG